MPAGRPTSLTPELKAKAAEYINEYEVLGSDWFLAGYIEWLRGDKPPAYPPETRFIATKRQSLPWTSPRGQK